MTSASGFSRQFTCTISDDGNMIFGKGELPVLLDLGTERKMNNSKAINDLGWKPIKPEETILSCAASILQLGIVKQK
jgi:hypothetical protein